MDMAHEEQHMKIDLDLIQIKDKSNYGPFKQHLTIFESMNAVGHRITKGGDWSFARTH